MPWTQTANIKGPAGIQGPQGPQGAPGPVGPAGLTWRGPWSPLEAYVVNDLVAWGGSSYYSTTVKNSGQPPPTGTEFDPGTDDTAVNAGWELLTMQGATGPQGPQGIQGPQGNTGAQGPQGGQGAPGTYWFTGQGVPTGANTPGAIPGDLYLDTDTGDVYRLT